jgi:PKD repeat protein
MWHRSLRVWGEVWHKRTDGWHGSGSSGWREELSGLAHRSADFPVGTLSLFAWKKTMRPNRLLTATIVTLTLAACGGDGGGVGPGGAPVANFTQACTDLACTFTDASTDPDGVTTITTRAWDFGDATSGTNTSSETNPTHTFSAAGTFNVKLTVTDNGGNTNSKTIPVTVTAPASGSPTADFTFFCNSLACTFTDASTDDGSIASQDWDFGDATTPHGTGTPVNHTYVATEATTFHVTLVVTDDAGLTGTISKDITVTPPAAGQCDNGSGNLLNCNLDITQKSTIKVTMVSTSCTARGNSLTLSTTGGFTQNIFTNGCKVVPGTEVTIQGGNPFAAGTQLTATITSGSTDPNRVAPQLKITGDFPKWTLEFDDGENPTGPGEPDFNDLVMEVNATVVP